MGVHDQPWLPHCSMVLLSLQDLFSDFYLGFCYTYISNDTIYDACSVRVSNELGKGNAKAAVFSIKVILTYSVSIGLFFWALFLAFGSQISSLFTSDAAVAEAISSLSVLLAFSMLLNSIQTVLTGRR